MILLTSDMNAERTEVIFEPRVQALHQRALPNTQTFGR
jgi:hypothetical protein